MGKRKVTGIKGNLKTSKKCLPGTRGHPPNPSPLDNELVRLKD